MQSVVVSVEQARAMRLVNLGLAPDASGSPRLDSLAEVATHHLAMQGQDFGAVRWAIASRLAHRHTGADDIHASFDAGELVRTWPMRGTVHVLASADACWLLDLCGPIALRGVKNRWKTLGIDESFADTVVAVTKKTLTGGRTATRDELVEAFTKAGLDFSESQRRYHAVWYACQTGTAVLGPTKNGDNLLALTSDYLSNAVRLDIESALATLGRRYLTARGPATIEDLQHWTKLTKTQCKQAFNAIGEGLVQVEVTGHAGPVLYALAEQCEATADLAFGDTVPNALALAAFDEHLLGYKDRSLVLDPSKATHVDPGRNGVFRNTVVLRGRVVGTWKRRLLKSTAPVDISLFENVRTADHKLIAGAFESWGRFVDREPVVTFAN